MQLSLMKKSEIIDFVEFNITGDAENYNRCDDESLYLGADVFNIFASCFERSNHLFDLDRKSTRLNSIHGKLSRMPSYARKKK